MFNVYLLSGIAILPWDDLPLAIRDHCIKLSKAHTIIYTMDKALDKCIIIFLTGMFYVCILRGLV